MYQIVQDVVPEQPTQQVVTQEQPVINQEVQPTQPQVQPVVNQEVQPEQPNVPPQQPNDDPGMSGAPPQQPSVDPNATMPQGSYENVPATTTTTIATDPSPSAPPMH